MRIFITFGLLLLLFTGCSSVRSISGHGFYKYDQSMALLTDIGPEKMESDFVKRRFTFKSVNGEIVYGVLSLPESQPMQPGYPVIILQHGLGDHKEVDYIQAGTRQFLENGYAVVSIDLANHGERVTEEFDFDFTGDTKYRTRQIITQSVFDLSRLVDFIESIPELDEGRIGYYGISLGGIIGTIFCAVDQRVKVPVIAIAGGNINLMFGMKALSGKVKDYLSVIDPINYVRDIAPRPFLMINAEQDEVIPPLMSKLLYKKARNPKDIIWYPTKHRELPVEKVYGDGVEWFDRYLN
ncbi:alpha/beta hydrolase [Membranihabitans maritimus]|uniref:alpha/beta hydrolase n=1 Tax=Membranihabitans maritimus TaxID=2904244 RepID=UPI001F1A1FE9|nr:alpha/beta hydrolase [Membranihabitans maritimus]